MKLSDRPCFPKHRLHTPEASQCDPFAMNETVYLLPGRGNKLTDIGDIVTSLGFDVCGREYRPPFSARRFPEQLAVIKKDISSDFQHSQAALIGHSYGGYLLMHTLAEMEAFPGRVLLLSPVLGESSKKAMSFVSRPPRAEKLLRLAESRQFPPPQYLEIHTGELDDGCDPVLAEKLGSFMVNTKVTVVKGQGHTLEKAYVEKTIRQFLEYTGAV